MLRQRLAQLANRLRCAQSPAALVEHTVRLLMFAVILLEQHQVNKRGRCQFCGRSRWKWRFWRRRPQCAVQRALVLALNQSLDVVWWQLCANTGGKHSLADVREWLAQREQQTHPTNPTVLSQPNLAVPLAPLPEQAGPAMMDTSSPSPDLPFRLPLDEGN